MSSCCRDGRCRGCKSDRRLVGIAVAALVAVSMTGNADADLALPFTTKAQPTMPAQAPQPRAATANQPAIPAVTVLLRPFDLKRLDTSAFGD